MREGWAGIFKCVMPVRSGLVVNDGQIGDGQQKGEEALRKKREKKKFGRRVIWAVGRRDLSSGGGTIWASPRGVLSLSLSLSL